MLVKERILLWIPMYNCEKQITRVLNQLHGIPEQYISEVIIVNNRSSDNGENAVIKYLQNNKFRFKTVLLRNQENYGLGGSHKVAWQYAIDNKFDYVITLHGDDQGHIEDLNQWIINGDFKNYDCLLGSRFMKGSILKGYSKLRTFGNILYNLMFSIATFKNIKDLGAGLNIYNVKMLKDYHYIKFADDLTINYFGVLALRCYHHKFKFFPITWSEDDQVSNVKLFRQGIKTVLLVVNFVLSRKKFISSEHRKKIIDKYLSDVVYETGE